MSESFADPVETFGGRTESAAQDAIFDILSDQARCSAIQCLAMGNDAMSLEDLMDTVAVVAQNDSEVTDFDLLGTAIDINGARTTITAVSDNLTGRTSISLPDEDPLSLGRETRGMTDE